MGALNTTVHVHDVPFSTNGDVKTVFGPGDDVPDWALAQMGPHCFEDGEHPKPELLTGKNAEAAAAAAPPADREPGTPPPMKGTGSGRDNWAAYADEVDVQAKGLKRDEIIAAISAAGHPVE